MVVDKNGKGVYIPPFLVLSTDSGLTASRRGKFCFNLLLGRFFLQLHH